MEYKPGNKSDIFKHHNLEELLVLTRPTTYVELHSGEGIYNNKDEAYIGSPLRAINFLKDQNKEYKVYLNECDISKNAKLRKAVFPNNNVIINHDWKLNIKDHIKNSNETYLFMIDPCYLSDYYEINGILDYLPAILNTNANIFMYVPQQLKIRTKQNEDTLNQIRQVIINSKRDYIDLMHKSDNSGRFSRKDHNFLISFFNIDSEINNFLYEEYQVYNAH